MDNGTINQTTNTAGDISQILGERICARKANRGEKSKKGRILPGQSSAFPLVCRTAKLARRYQALH